MRKISPNTYYRWFRIEMQMTNGENTHTLRKKKKIWMEKYLLQLYLFIDVVVVVVIVKII